MRPDDLTPDEYQALRLVRARAAIDRGDLSPMMRWTDRTEAPAVIPWLDALNLDVEIGR